MRHARLPLMLGTSIIEFVDFTTKMAIKLFTKRWNPFCGLYLQGLVRWGAIISLFGQTANVVHILVMVEHDYLPWQESYLEKPFNYNRKLRSHFKLRFNKWQDETIEFSSTFDSTHTSLGYVRIAWSCNSVTKSTGFQSCKPGGLTFYDLTLDTRAPLGSGTFGTVYRAILSRKMDETIQKVPVAVKTTNPLSSNVEHFKTLLCELKVMTWIGNHKNIVNFIGACTEDIKKLINTMDLVKWSNDIADGMDYLESRKIVHGDLAARNVLLTEHRIAKITDFGLSRQLYNYATYVKKKDVKLYRFIEEITEEADMASEFRDLTECELYDFENGREIPTTSYDFELKPFMDWIQYVKYKKDDFEIALRELELDKRMPLGSGTFGTVYRALLCRITDIERYPVAVKTTNPLSSNVEHFKALLSELKVMTFIGNHKNIVNLIGACTEDVKKRKLYIVVELCVFGNLQTYLKSQRGTFNDLTEDASYIKRHISISFNNDESSTSTKDLVRWAKEIADGMQFLESRKVVHGDLAARNVLLTEQRVAKITDFGLSRQLYNYAVYTKTQNSPLPWRWLSLETILDMQFSSQSDVWSYGVTIWEMFQLGDTPWPGSKFCVDFVEELKSGMRLNKPAYAMLVSFWAIYVCVIIFSFILNHLLLKAANQKNTILLKLFIGLSVVHSGGFQIIYWTHTIYFSYGLPNPRMAAFISQFVIRAYLLYGVFRFIDEINEEAKMANGFRDLADYEMCEFYTGPSQDELSLPITDNMHTEKAACLECLHGTAILSRLTDSQGVPVAVKTTNPLSSNVEHFKALLCELKVMTWIGNHENIVNLLGACTEDIKKRKLYIVLELCAFGNMQTYLRSQRGTFIDLTESTTYSGSHISVALCNDEESTSTMDLVRWAKEIADGMQFLESRKVVHGDLAARNILLTEQRVAKITDFGLSRQLYNYAVYTKTQNSPLPWRWLSLETILDMQFSTYSDIWSFGVTIWELFQLGETPWSKYTFGMEFVNGLKRGNRMGTPQFATQNMYW
ncbi:Vascular endothelial growth factor receptor 3 [Orchesella cincta]|uniref:receptor protein-tyrosine kinase n=1 Tax=Orchesella cincta TaxID=48709 RepID=A0A1D2NL44_ORCCI|nr:Vascular endothelial growth factor receptor 3 [Orchesella cincta]